MPRLDLPARLSRDWRLIVRHAWSLRLTALAFVLIAFEAARPLWRGALDLPHGLFAALGLVALAAALAARVIAQKPFGPVRRRLHREWKKIVRHAWSVRFLSLAGVLSGVETALPFTQGYLPVSPGIFAGLSGIATCAAFVARIASQKQFGVSGE